MPGRTNALEVPRQENRRDEGQRVYPKCKRLRRKRSPLEEYTECDSERTRDEHAQPQVFDSRCILRSCFPTRDEDEAAIVSKKRPYLHALQKRLPWCPESGGRGDGSVWLKCKGRCNRGRATMRVSLFPGRLHVYSARHVLGSADTDDG